MAVNKTLATIQIYIHCLLPPWWLEDFIFMDEKNNKDDNFPKCYKQTNIKTF